MKRAVGYGLLVLVVLSLVGLVLFGSWLLGTTNGARWTIETLSRHTSLKISAARVQGRLLDRLLLEGVSLRSGPKEAKVASLKLAWRPLRLLARKVVVDELTLTGVVVQDDTPPSGKPVNLSLPQLPAMADLLDVTVERLTVEKLRYRHLNDKPVELQQVSAVVIWHDQVLSLPSLSLRAPEGAVGGSMAVGFGRPALRLNLAVRPAKVAAGMDTFAVRAGLVSGRGQEALAGRMTLTGQGQGTTHLQLQSELGVTRTAIKLRRLYLVRPGRKGTVTGDGSLDLATKEPTVQLVLAAHGLDLSRELKRPAEITGTVALAGSKDRYQGRFDLANRGPGWQTATIAASFHGRAQELSLANIDGTILGGRLAGNLRIAWQEGMSATGHLEAKGLDPARIAKGWTGTVNLAAGLEVVKPKRGGLQGTVEMNIIDSMLHGQPLTGGVKGSFAGTDVQLANLDLHGRGFDIHGAGDLARRLDLTAVVADLSKLVPGTSGEIRLAGWGAWKDGQAAGAITVVGSKLKGHGIGVGSFSGKADLARGAGQPVSVDLRVQKASYGQFQAETVRLAMAGRIGNHAINLGLTAPEASLDLAVAGGYTQGGWHGTIDSLLGTDGIGAWHLLAPAPLQVSRDRISLGRLAVAGTTGERFEASGVLKPLQLVGNATLKWQELNLNRMNPWLQGVRVEGRSSGDLEAAVLAEKRLSFRANAEVRGKVTKEGRAVTIQQANLHAVGNGSGITGSITLQAAEGVRLEGTVATASPARLSLPDEGTMALQWRVADLAVLQPWMKGAVKISGGLQGRIQGKFLSGNRLAMDGDLSLTGGMLHWQKPQGEGRMALKDVSATWVWQGEKLQGKVGLTLAEYGKMQGNFTLPVPAALPVAADTNGAVFGTFTGQLQEQGVLSAFLPGLVQESHGKVAVDVGVKGIWREPELTGRVQLTGAGAYLPSAGIRVRDLALTANLERDQVTVSFSAASGAGMIRGDGITMLQGWHVASYRGTLSGDHFQLIHLPEMEAAASPQLSLAGDVKKLMVRGEVGLPELLIHGQPPKASVQPSKDVILEGQPVEKKPLPLALDVQVRVILGDRVLVKAVGLDAQLGGTMDLTATTKDNISSKGEIKVVKGRYKAYGLDLNIDRGRIFYAGGPVNEPLLDVLALRKVGEVRAGVTVTGTTRNPVVKLYSEPAMPDMDILAYMVLGHPLGASSEQAGLMANAAGLLLSTGQSVVLQDQIKNRLGLSTIDIESGQQDAAARMGYKAIPVTPSGTAPSKQADTGVSQSVLTLGKYLTPQLYISYGRSIFTGANLFRMRYDISRRLQLETETGSESGADLYYKMMFN